MGGLFSIFVIPVRAAFVLMTIASVSVTALLTYGRSEQPVDPFAPYADIMPGQSRDAVSQHGFNCQLVILLFNESCLLNPEMGIFSEIQVRIGVDGRVRSVIFTPREKTLTYGDLVLLWGRPQIAIYSRIANLRWPNVDVVTIPPPHSRPFSYWHPIIYVAFESTDGT
jgi:hypothetical protein